MDLYHPVEQHDSSEHTGQYPAGYHPDQSRIPSVLGLNREQDPRVVRLWKFSTVAKPHPALSIRRSKRTVFPRSLLVEGKSGCTISMTKDSRWTDVAWRAVPLRDASAHIPIKASNRFLPFLFPLLLIPLFFLYTHEIPKT